MADIEAYGTLLTGGSIKVSFLGSTPDGVDGIKFDRKTAKENVYTMGKRKPVGRIRKNTAFTGEITVKQMLLASLEKLATDGDLALIKPFTIGVTGLDENESVIKHYNLLYVEFTGASFESKNDNNEIVHTLELVIGDIKAQ